MKINIIAIGKLSKEYKQLIDKYIKKISFYGSLNIIELKEVNEKNIELQKQKETENILKHIPKNSDVFLCSLKGKQYSSEEFSNFFNKDNLTFIIGGSHGTVEEHFKNKINFSKMTFPHQLFRVFLVEQIFRGLAIKNNLKYHK